MDGLTTAAIRDLGLLGLMAVAVTAFLRGHVIPLIIHNQIVEQWKATCADLKESNEVKDKEISRLHARNDEYSILIRNGNLLTQEALAVARLVRHSSSDSEGSQQSRKGGANATIQADS
jgi:hypothetical protein